MVNNVLIVKVYSCGVTYPYTHECDIYASTKAWHVKDVDKNDNFKHTSLYTDTFGAAMKTTNGANSAVRRTFSAYNAAKKHTLRTI